MNKYQNLLLNIADKYKILQGKHESEDEWKVRIIYSICGMMAYVSLWDEISEEPVSITHLKHRIRSVLESYLELYPEIEFYFPYVKQEFADEFTKIYLKTGMMYHKPNRLSPPIETYSKVANVCFMRGISIEKIKCISGIGFYDITSSVNTSLSIQEMFQLNEYKLLDFWSHILNQANWSADSEFNSDTEFLKMEQPFSRGYWVNKPYSNGCVSILRTGMKGTELYYLYRYNGKTFEISPLPNWQVTEQQYREIACACLNSYDSLPAINYSVDGNLVHLHLNYLLPPHELFWIKLYSWPETCNVLPCDFYRKCSVDVFNVFQKNLSDRGYEFNKR